MLKTLAAVGILVLVLTARAWAQPTEITTCGTITQPGSYILAHDIGAPGTGNPGGCLMVANDTIIDLAGFEIEGERGGGIGGGDNVTVRNGTIAGEGIAVRLGKGAIVTGLNINLGGGGAEGIIVTTGVVRDNVISGSPSLTGGIGISVAGAGLILNNYITDTHFAGIAAGSGSLVIRNTSIDNAGAGISAHCPAKLIDNTVTGNGQNLVLNGTGCLVVGAAPAS